MKNKDSVDGEDEGKVGVRIATGSSVLWLALVAILLYRNWSKVTDMKPNEFGDMAAGAFAPLAFFWLVYGFFLQREELKLQRRELAATVREQAAQAEATKRLAESAATQAKISQDQLDHFLRGKRGNLRHTGTATVQSAGVVQRVTLEFRNIGGDMFNVQAAVEGFPNAQGGSRHPRRGEEYAIVIPVKSGSISFPLQVSIRWDDEVDLDQKTTIKVLATDKSQSIRLLI